MSQRNPVVKSELEDRKQKFREFHKKYLSETIRKTTKAPKKKKLAAILEEPAAEEEADAKAIEITFDDVRAAIRKMPF